MSKKIVLIICIALFTVLITGCVTIPSIYSAQGEIAGDEGMEFLGMVKIKIRIGANAETVRERLMEEAKELYGESVDDVIDVSSQNSYVFFGFYKESVVEGKAVNYLGFDMGAETE